EFAGRALAQDRRYVLEAPDFCGQVPLPASPTLLPLKTLDRVQDVGAHRPSSQRRFRQDAVALSIRRDSKLRQNTSVGTGLSFVGKMRAGQEIILRKIERPASTCENKACGPPGGLFGIDQEVFTLKWPLRPLRVPDSALHRPASSASILNHR